MLSQAHFDCVPPHFTVIDGARSKWCHLLLVNAIIGILDFESFNLAARRKFNQQQILADCLRAALEEQGIVEASDGSFGTISVTLDSSWQDMKSLRNFLERNAPYKSKEKYLGILDILLSHKVIRAHAFDIERSINAAIAKALSPSNRRAGRKVVPDDGGAAPSSKLAPGSTKGGQPHSASPFGSAAPTIAQLYAGTTHRDRENLYISVVSGLSLDLTREKFRTMVLRVLAPRAGVAVSDEQVLNLFGQFDINNGGTVSYFEYLAALRVHLTTPNQQRFCRNLHARLCVAAAAARLKKTSRAPTPAGRSRPPTSKGGLPPRMQGRVGAVVSLPPDADPGVEGLEAPERLPYFHSAPPVPLARAPAAGSAAGDSSSKAPAGQQQQPSPNAADASLSREDITPRAVETAVFDLLNKSLLFPHPAEAQLAARIQACFDDLSPTDRVDEPKFSLLLFCDDDVVDAMRELVP